MTDTASADSVPLEAFQEEDQDKSVSKRAPLSGIINLKLIFALFIIFVVVVSDVFTNNIISGFGEKAVRCRSATSWGTVLQGIFLVIFYILVVYLINNRIL